ncbi:MAG: hypothetical protein WD557_14755 [Dehalococcoidia bacterium]
MSFFFRRTDHRHCWGPALAFVPGNAAGAMLVSFCATCGKRRRCRAA